MTQLLELTFPVCPDCQVQDPIELNKEGLNFQAVIKSAASAASPTAWERPRGRRPPAEDVVLALPCNSQAVGEAALAADLITA